jgi:hypothetical protein
MGYIKTFLLEIPQRALNHMAGVRQFERTQPLKNIFKPSHNGIPYNLLSTIDKIGVDFRVSLAKTKEASPASPIWIAMDFARNEDIVVMQIFNGRGIQDTVYGVPPYMGALQSIALAGRHKTWEEQQKQRTLDQRIALNNLGIAMGRAGDIMAQAVIDINKAFTKIKK